MTVRLRPHHLLGAALASFTLSVADVPSSAATLEHQLRDTRGKAARTREQLHANRSTQSALERKIEADVQRIEQLQEPVTGLDARIAELDRQVARRERELVQLRARSKANTHRLASLTREHEAAEQQMAVRLAAIYRSGDTSYSSVFLEARSLADIASKIDISNRVAEQDAALISDVRRLRRQVESQQLATRRTHQRIASTLAGLNADKRSLATKRARLASQQQALSVAVASRDAQLTSLTANEALLRQNLQSLAASSAGLQATIQAAPAIAPPAPEPPPAADPAPTPAPGQDSDSSTAAPGTSTPPPGPGASTPPAAPAPAPAAPRPPASTTSLAWPVSGPVVSAFGTRWGSFHYGIDISAPAGTPVRSAAAGRVIYAGWMSGYGNLVVVQHPGSLSTAYAHLSSLGAGMGSSVSQGQTIGAVGCTGTCYGDHLHFETRMNGAAVNPHNYL